MITFLKTNKILITYSLILLLVLPIFGFKFVISFVGNIMLVLFLIPLLLLIIFFVGLNSFKQKINTCTQCGNVSFGTNNKCLNCGFDFENVNTKESKPSGTTIEIKAEEIK